MIIRSLTPYEAALGSDGRVREMRRLLQHVLHGPGAYPGDRPLLTLLERYALPRTSRTDAVRRKAFSLIEELPRSVQEIVDDAMTAATWMGRGRMDAQVVHQETLPHPIGLSKVPFRPRLCRPYQQTAVCDCGLAPESDPSFLRDAADTLSLYGVPSDQDVYVGIKRAVQVPRALLPLLFRTIQQLLPYGYAKAPRDVRHRIFLAQQLCYRHAKDETMTEQERLASEQRQKATEERLWRERQERRQQEEAAAAAARDDDDLPHGLWTEASYEAAMKQMGAGGRDPSLSVSRGHHHNVLAGRTHSGCRYSGR